MKILRNYNDLCEVELTNDEYKKISQQSQLIDKCLEVIEFYGDLDNYMDFYYGNYGLIEESGSESCGFKARELLNSDEVKKYKENRNEKL